MAPPVLDPTASCQATLKQAMVLIRQAEEIERNAEERDDLAQRKTDLEPAEDLVAKAATLLAPLRSNNSGQCPILFAEEHLTELKARLAAHQHDCVTSQALLSTLSGPYLAAKTYYVAALCRHAEGGADSSPEDRQAVYQAAAAAVDHADPTSPYWASRAWALYADSVEYLPRAEDEASPPDVLLSLEHAVDLDPNNVDALLKLAYRTHQIGDSWEALALLDRAELYTPRNQNQIWQLWNLRMTIAAQQHDPEAGLAVINTAIAMHPQVGMFHIDRLSHLLGMERHVEMAVALRDSLALLASDPVAHKNLQRDFLDDVLRNSTLDSTTPSAEIVAAVHAMQDAVPDEPCLLLLRGRIERRAATTFAERFRIHHWFETQQARHTTLDPFLRQALDAERIAQHNHLAEFILSNSPTDRERATARALCTSALQLAESHLQHDALVNSDAEGRILAGAAEAAYDLGNLDGDVRSYQRAVTYWQRYQTQIVSFDDVVALETRLDGLIQTAQIEVWLAQADYLVSTLIDTNPETELAALHSVQSEIMGHIAAHLDTLVKGQEYDRAVALYRKTAAVLSQHPLLEEATFAFQNQFFRTVIAGQPFGLAHAVAMCGDNPSDPMLLLLVAYAHTLEPDTPASAQRGATLMDQAWKQQSRIATSLRPIFAQMLVATHTAVLRQTAGHPGQAAHSSALLPTLDRVVRTFEEHSPNDLQAVALAAAYHAAAGLHAEASTHTAEALRLSNVLVARTDQQMIESTEEADMMRMPSGLWIASAATWTTLIALAADDKRPLDASRLYVACSVLAALHQRAELQRHFFTKVVSQPLFDDKDATAELKDFAAYLFVHRGGKDPVLTYLHVMMTRRHQTTQKNPWTENTLIAYQEVLHRFEAVWAESKNILPELELPFTIERILQHNYVGKILFQQLEDKKSSAAVLTKGVALAEAAVAKYPGVVEIAVDLAWGHYWLAKITGDLFHYDTARDILRTVEPKLKHKGVQESHVSERLHELYRLVGWISIKRARDLMRDDRNYGEAQRVLRDDIAPLVRKVAQLPAESSMARQDGLFFTFSFHYLSAEAMDHERLMRVSLLPITAPLPAADVSGTAITQANALRDQALRVLDQFIPGERQAEVDRARGCALLRKGFKEAQAAIALSHRVLHESPDTRNANNLNAARECHIMALRLESRISTLLPEKRLANFVALIYYTKEQLDAQKGRPQDQEQFTTAVQDLKTHLTNNMNSDVAASYRQLCRNEPRRAAMRDVVKRVWSDHKFDEQLLSPILFETPPPIAP